MANALYPKFKEALLNKIHDMNSDTIKACLVDSGAYTYNVAHDELADVAAGVVATSGALGSPTITDGVFDTADFSWTAVSGAQCEAIVLYNDTTASAPTDGLILFMDTGITGMPITPNGGNINVTVNGSGWFAL